MLKLNFDAERLWLEIDNQAIEIPLSLANLTAQFTPYPPSEMAWEAAIIQVKDAISPLRDRLLDFNEIELVNAEPLTVLGSSISAETFERAFAVLVGYCPTQDLPNYSIMQKPQPLC